MNSEPSLAIIASTMRSGSTLLKALLSEADDVLNLPEINFQNQKVVERILKEHAPGDAPIKLLKKPCWYHETRHYPSLPGRSDIKVVALVRDVYDTVTSLRKMTFRSLSKLASPFVTTWLARVYWVRVTTNLLRLTENQPQNTRLVRYEDLVADPIRQTRQLYEFIGSSCREGTKSYSPPGSYSWQWGSDDGSDNIRSLEVQCPREKLRNEARILTQMQECPAIRELRVSLGYADG